MKYFWISLSIGAFIIVLLISRTYFGELGKSAGKTTQNVIVKKLDEKNDDYLNSYLLRASDELNKDLPKMEGEGVLSGLTHVEGNALVYKVTLINLSDNSVKREEFIKEKRPLIISDLCRKKSVLFNLKKGIEYAYDVYTKENILISRFIVRINDCNP